VRRLHFRRPMTKRVLLVGHCGIDGPRLLDEISRALPTAHVGRVNSEAELREACAGGAALLLINREPVGFDRGGLDLVREVKSDYPECTVMLVSDKADAQREAIEWGAVQGFGKSELGSPSLTDRVKQHLS
jgi:hypothetical protein